jgi:hypothetical protein
MNVEEVQAGDLSILELLFAFFRRHVDSFLAYVTRLSSMDSVQTFLNAAVGIALKSVLKSFNEEGIVRGLRVIESIVEIRNNDILACLSGTYAYIMPSLLDLVFTVYFSSCQMSMAKILIFIAQFAPNEFR